METRVPQDADTLAAALEKASGSPGARICLAPGSYDLGMIVKVTDEVHIFGIGSRDDVILHNGTVMFTGNGGGAVLENLTIKGRSCAVQICHSCTAAPTIRFCDLSCGNDAMWVFGALRLEHTVVHNCGDCGVNAQLADSQATVAIECCEFHHCGTAVAMNRTIGKDSHLRVQQNYIHDCEKVYDIHRSKGIVSQNRVERNEVLGNNASNVVLEANDEQQVFQGLGASPEQRRVVLTISAQETVGGLEFTFLGLAGNTVARLDVAVDDVGIDFFLHSKLSEEIHEHASCIVVVTASGDVLERAAISPSLLFDQVRSA
eukprot:TRINITY_DN56629_c0_g1_i1.p1 TRINITY_DN56629_c0_g1~~TRINITY_DN56629_c0_g1_i1.p1  ORF type:complete len:317 (-),score=47.04 TRINITY_DN56629_c0_g1_i1:98-1048(-)